MRVPIVTAFCTLASLATWGLSHKNISKPDVPNPKPEGSASDVAVPETTAVTTPAAIAVPETFPTKQFAPDMGAGGTYLGNASLIPQAPPLELPSADVDSLVSKLLESQRILPRHHTLANTNLNQSHATPTVGISSYRTPAATQTASASRPEEASISVPPSPPEWAAASMHPDVSVGTPAQTVESNSPKDEPQSIAGATEKQVVPNSFFPGELLNMDQVVTQADVASPNQDLGKSLSQSAPTEQTPAQVATVNTSVSPVSGASFIVSVQPEGSGVPTLGTVTTTSQDGTYTLAAGDRIQSGMFEVPNYSKKYRFAESPQLASANAITLKPLHVAIFGEVSRPGHYVMTGSGSGDDTPTLTQAIQLAGGVTPKADIRQVQIRRSTGSGSEQIINVDLWQLLQTNDLSQDAILQQGDTVMIPTTTALKAGEAKQVGADSSSATLEVKVVGKVKHLIGKMAGVRQ